MRKPSRALRVLGAVGLVIGLLAAMMAPVSAQQESPSGPTRTMPFQTTSPGFRHGDNTIYYPWVANDDDFGLGPADTSISVQNLEDRDGQIWIYVGDGNGNFSLVTTAFLSAYASKTFTAADLGIAEGSGAPVAVSGYYLAPAIGSATLVETTITLSRPTDVDAIDAQVDICVPMEVLESTEEGEPSFTGPAPFMLAIESLTWNGVTYEQGDFVPWSDQNELQAILNSVNSGGQLVNPFGGLNQDGDCLDAIVVVEGSPAFLDSLSIGGIAKAAVNGEGLPLTTEADTSVSGYNALNGWEIAQFDEWYLPIVQTNCGPGGCWDSMLRVANVGAVNNAVTVRFFPADDGSGSLNTGFQLQDLVNGGETWHINLGDYVPEGWVGSAHIYSDGAVFAMVDRYKVGYDMWLTNTGSSADFENLAQIDGSNDNYVLFAPHVLMDYFGWNTGINVANLVNQDNNVTIQYFNMLGNATEVLNQRLAAHGMTYFYDPSQAPQDGNDQQIDTDPETGAQADVNANIVGSALLWSDYPVAAVVDATKYPESDPTGREDLFQATSYSATSNVFTWQAVPLVQKGNPIDGMGTTSGINIMNPNPTAATANVHFVNQSGFNAQNFGVSSVTVPAFANGFVYTLTQQNLPNGFWGAAQVISDVPVAVVSANVNYQVEGDGSAIYNAFNPCGLYRSAGLTVLLDELGVPVEDEDGNLVYVPACTFGDPLDVAGGSVTKTFVDPSGDPVAGVQFHIVNDNPDFPYQRDAISGVDGSVTLTNVPVGNYELNVDVVPSGYTLPENPADEFTLNEGDDLSLTNTIGFGQGVSKTVVVAGAESLVISGIDVAVFEVIGEDAVGAPVIDDEPVFVGVTNTDGVAGASLAPGDYVLCIYADDSGVAMVGDQVVTPALPDAPDLLSDNCEAFPVVEDELTELVNAVGVDGLSGEFVITSDNLDALGFTENEAGDATASIEEGPGDPPFGEGSLGFDVGANGSDYARLMLTTFDGMSLESLSELSYFTYIENREDGTCVAPYIALRLDTDGNGTQDETIYFEPCYQHAGYGVPDQGETVLGVWQEWDAMIGAWRLFDDGAPLSGQTIAVIAEMLPGATIVAGSDGLGGVHLVGGGGNTFPNMIAYVDGFTIGVEGGPTFTYDFEP